MPTVTRRRRRKPADPSRLPEVLNLTGIAALLGVDPATARAMVDQGIIPALVFGRRVVRASKTAILRAMEQGGMAAQQAAEAR